VPPFKKGAKAKEKAAYKGRSKVIYDGRNPKNICRSGKQLQGHDKGLGVGILTVQRAMRMPPTGAGLGFWDGS
jgi:hypothetical protein